MTESGIWQDWEKRQCFCDSKPRTKEEYKAHLLDGTHERTVNRK